MASVALYGCDDSGDNGGAPVVMTFAVLAAMRQLFQERDLEVMAVCPWLTWGCRRQGHASTGGASGSEPPPRECEPGDRRCLEEGGVQEQECEATVCGVLHVSGRAGVSAWWVHQSCGGLHA